LRFRRRAQDSDHGGHNAATTAEMVQKRIILSSMNVFQRSVAAFVRPNKALFRSGAGAFAKLCCVAD
jgi:hypothetical protein